MTTDLANIEETRRALQDLRFDREKYTRIQNQLPNDNEELLDYVHGRLEVIRRLEESLKEHLDTILKT